MPQPALMSLMRLEMMKGMMHSMTTSIATRMGGGDGFFFVFPYALCQLFYHIALSLLLSDKKEAFISATRGFT